MLKLKVIRPNTVGTTFEDTYDSYADAEEFIERKVERLCDKGWQATELKGSTSASGSIELTHDDAADSILIAWETLPGQTWRCNECGNSEHACQQDAEECCNAEELCDVDKEYYADLKRRRESK